MALLTKSAFTQRFLDEFRRQCPEITYELIDELELKGKLNELEHNIFLHNAYHAYQDAPESLQAIFNQYVAVSKEFTANGMPVDANNIVPVVKGIDFLGSVNHVEEKASGELDHLIEILNDDLIIVYANDSPQSISYFPREKLESLGMTLPELRKKATKNLLNIVGEIKGEMVAEGIVMVSCGGNYEASLILNDDLWVAANFPLPGELVIAMPARGMLVVTGSELAPQVAYLRMLTRKTYQESSYSISDSLFRRVDGKWVKY